MDNVWISKQVKIDMTCFDWELHWKENYQGCTDCADALNMAFESHFNAGKTRQQLVVIMSNVMVEWSKYGANDTEPRRVLYNLLNECFGEK